MNDTTKTIIRGVAILVAFGGAFLVTKRIVKRYRERKEADRQDTLQTELQGGQSQTMQQIEEQQSTYNPSNHVSQIEDFILGPNLDGYESEVSAIIMPLSATDTKKLADAWKNKHGRTLWYDLDDEYDQCGSWYYPFENCYKAPMGKLESLGLT